MELEQHEDPAPEIRTNVDFVRHVENTLGFVLDPDKPAWRSRSIEAGKLKRKRAKDPEKYSMRNLLLTVEYLRRNKREVKSPAAVCWLVDEALEHVLTDTPSDLDSQIATAIETERTFGGQESEDWIRQLSRTRGPARAEVLADWRQQRG